MFLTTIKAIFRESKSKRKGLTLIELLIVIALSSLLIGSLFTTYLQIQNLLFQQSDASKQSEKALQLIKMITTDLQNLTYQKWNPQAFFFKGKKEITHSVRTDYIKFPSGSYYSNPATLQSRVFSVTYYGYYDDETDTIGIYRKEDFFVDKDEESPGVGILILPNVQSFEIEYSTDGEDFNEEWDIALKKDFPKHIRFVVSWNEDDLQREISFEVQPYILSY